MRQIGTLKDQSQAKVFGDFLYSRHIENEIEHDPQSDNWVVWILDDDHLKEAMGFLEHFQSSPGDPRYLEGAAQGRAKWQDDKKEVQEATGKVIDARTQVFGQQAQMTIPFLTFGLVFISVGTFVVQSFVPSIDIASMLRISNYLGVFLPEVTHGQIWRLVTPIFLHFGIIHIVFNMLWLKDLGALIEQFHGLALFSAMVLVLAVTSNIGQYFASGPSFGGMSGVVYGLLGFVWMRSKFDRTIPYQLPGHIVIIMIVWFFLCLSGAVGNIANTAHGVGLIVGMVFGYGTSGHLRLLFR